MKQRHPYATEAELCADFNAWALQEGWTPYPETAAWDIVLVAADGTQIGVQAKLKFNLKVIGQTLPEHWDSSHDNSCGPDFRAVLVPERESIADSICGALGIVLMHPLTGFNRRDFCPSIRRGQNYSGGWHYWNPRRRLKLPEYVPDVVAGASGPVQLTEWKIKALRICAVLELRGHVTRLDFSRYGLDHRRWTGPGGWLVAGATPGQWQWKDDAKGFGPDHPVVYPKVLDATREELKQVDGRELVLTA